MAEETLRMERCCHCGALTGNAIRVSKRAGYCSGCQAVIDAFGTITPNTPIARDTTAYDDAPPDEDYSYHYCPHCDGDDFFAVNRDGAEIAISWHQDEESVEGFIWVEREDRYLGVNHDGCPDDSGYELGHIASLRCRGCNMNQGGDSWGLY